jgi:hypothetical protein
LGAIPEQMRDDEPDDTTNHAEVDAGLSAVGMKSGDLWHWTMTTRTSYRARRRLRSPSCLGAEPARFPCGDGRVDEGVQHDAG